VELAYCFAFLIAAHTVVANRLLGITAYLTPGYSFLNWVSIGGIGTLTIWFACDCRSTWQRLIRFSIAVFAFQRFAGNSLTLFGLPKSPTLQSPYGLFIQYGGLSPARDGLMSGFIPAISRQGTPPGRMIFDFATAGWNWTLVYWLLGSLFAAFLIKCITGLQFVAPGLQATKSKTSMRSIFLLVLFAAILRHLIRGQHWEARLSFLCNGATHAVISAACAWSVFHPDRGLTRLKVPICTYVTVVATDIAGGGLFGAWDGVLDRLLYVNGFVAGLAVSPMLTFVVLRRYGFRITHAWSNLDLPSIEPQSVASAEQR
jgi:hypothetical protein